MLELTGLGSVLRGIGVLYWLLAFTAIGLAIWKGRTPKRKALWAGVWIVVFGAWPAKVAVEGLQRQTYEHEAWAYFKKKCETEAGEKIYKTFTGVKSVLIVKPLPPATEKDLYDQFWYGDPYSADAISMRVDNAAGTLVYRDAPISMQARGKGFEFVESYVVSEKIGEKMLFKYFVPLEARDYRKEAISQPVSRFGLAWEDISTTEDRKYWVAGRQCPAAC